MNGLLEHLRRSEIEYIATHGGGYPKTFSWGEDVLAHAKTLGLTFKRGVDDIDGHKWVRTKNGISICLDDGFVIKG